jgi:hypothetical protein
MDTVVTAPVVAAAAGFSPTELALMLGPVLSHAVAPIASKIPESIRPTIIAVGSIAAGAFAASSQTGQSFSQSLSYGLGTALAAKLYHLGVLKDGGALSAFAGAFIKK